MHKRIAILYDFDDTLANGFMQQFGMMQDMGFSDVYDFFRATDDAFNNNPDMDMCLNMMGGILKLAKKNNIQITREYLQSLGKNIEYYQGVSEWFDKINAIAENKGYNIEHYIISSGLKEVIEGCQIYPYFKRVYSNNYIYDENGCAYWPCQVVNYSNKIQYIYRVRKNALDSLGSLEEVNAKMSESDVLPFKNIIYLGDSQTDIPSFKVVKNSGGLSICVYRPDSSSAKAVAEKCFVEGRVNNFYPADYREGSLLFDAMKEYLNNIMESN